MRNLYLVENSHLNMRCFSVLSSQYGYHRQLEFHVDYSNSTNGNPNSGHFEPDIPKRELSINLQCNFRQLNVRWMQHNSVDSHKVFVKWWLQSDSVEFHEECKRCLEMFGLSFDGSYNDFWLKLISRHIRYILSIGEFWPYVESILKWFFDGKLNWINFIADRTQGFQHFPHNIFGLLVLWIIQFDWIGRHQNPFPLYFPIDGNSKH